MTASASTDAAAYQEEHQQQQQQQHEREVGAAPNTTTSGSIVSEQQQQAPPPSSSPPLDNVVSVKQQQQKRQRQHPFMPFSMEHHQQQQQQQQLLLTALSPERKSLNDGTAAKAAATSSTPPHHHHPPVLVRRHSTAGQSTSSNNSPSTITLPTSSFLKNMARGAGGRGRVGGGRGGGRPWTKALQRVLHNSTGNRFSRQKQSAALQELQSAPDPLGIALTKILNQHQAFNGGNLLKNEEEASSSSSSSSSDYCCQPQHFSYPPFLSRHNFVVAKTRLQATWQLSWRQLLTQCWQGLCSILLCFLSRKKEERQSLYSTVQAVFLFQVVLILLLCLLLLVALLWTVQGVVYTSSTLFYLLVDVKDVETMIYYVYAANYFQATWRVLCWIDCYLLRGIRFQGREWNGQAFCFVLNQKLDENNTSAAAIAAADAILLSSSSESTTLWELPPPTVQIELASGEVTTTRLCRADGNDWMKKQLLLQQRGDGHNSNDNSGTATTATAWSTDTLDHVVAIDFCCVMLQHARLNEKRERKEKRQKQQQKMNKKQQQQIQLRQQHQRHSLNASELKLPQLDEEDQDDDGDNDDDDDVEERRRRRIRARSDPAFLAGQSPSAVSTGSNNNIVFGEDASSNAVVIIRQVRSDDRQHYHQPGSSVVGAGSGDDDHELVGAGAVVMSPVEAIELKVCGQDEEAAERKKQQQKRRWRQRQKRQQPPQQKDPAAAGVLLGGEYSWPDDEHTVDNDNDNHTNSGILSDGYDEDGHSDVNSHDNVPGEDNADDSVSFNPTRHRRGGGGMNNNHDESDFDQYSDDPFSIGSDDFSPSSSHHGGGGGDGGGRRTRASSMSSSEAAADRPWLDVGAEIGLKLLNSAHVHRAVASQETTDRIIMGAMETTQSLMREKSALSAVLAGGADDTGAAAAGNHTSATSGHGAAASAQVMLAKPIHPMWTSPGAAMYSSFRGDYDACSDYSSSAPPYSAFGSPPASPRFSLPSLSSTPQYHQQQQLQAPRTPIRTSVAAESTLTPISQTDAKARPPLSPQMPSPGVVRRVLRRRPSQDNELISKQRITMQRQQHPVSPVPSISTWSTWSPSDQKRHPLTMSSHQLQANASPKTEAEEAKTSGSTRTLMGTLPAISPRLDTGGPFFGHDYDTHPWLRLDQPQQLSRCVNILPTTPRQPLAPGVKVAVPILPNQPTFTFSFYTRRCVSSLVYQMGTVVASQRIFVGEKNGMAGSAACNENDDTGHNAGPAAREYHHTMNNTNCLSVTVKLEKSFLRNGEFGTYRLRGEKFSWQQ
jgi:signal transduction histidine kinase